MVKYTHLLYQSLNRQTGCIFGREAKWHHSKRLPPKSYIKRLSMPDLDSFCTFLNEACISTQTSKMPGRTICGL